jgi:hypothetical protein
MRLSRQVRAADGARSYMADVTDPEIRTAFEAEKRFWLAQLGQAAPEPPPVPPTASP